MPIGSEFAPLMEFPDVAVTSQFIRRARPPLNFWPSPTPARSARGERRAVNQLGLTPPLLPGARRGRRRRPGWWNSAAPIVESAPATIDLGGTALEFVYCTDPDGVRVELMDLGG